MVEQRFQFEDIFKQEDVLELEQHEAELRKAAEAARACLNNEKFIQYKKATERLLHDMPIVLIGMTNDYFRQETGDMAFYGAKVLRYITKIQDLMILLKAVEYDVNVNIKGEANEANTSKD